MHCTNNPLCIYSAYMICLTACITMSQRNNTRIYFSSLKRLSRTCSYLHVLFLGTGPGDGTCTCKQSSTPSLINLLFLWSQKLRCFACVRLPPPSRMLLWTGYYLWGLLLGTHELHIVFRQFGSNLDDPTS